MRPLARNLGFAAAFVLAGVFGFVSTLYVLERKPGWISKGQATIAAATGPTRCEVELGPERCPGLPTFEPAKQFRTFSDNWEGSGEKQDRCMKRAAEFRSACAGKSPVTVRFFRGNQVVQTITAP